MRIVQIGVGKMSIYTIRYIYEKGGEVIGAFDINPNLIGKDIGEICNIEKKNIYVEDINNLSLRLKELKPDIAIVMTMSLLTDVYDTLLTCAECGINVITTCEEAFDPYNSNPSLTKKLDEVAKQNNCTITGSGYQDIYWGNLISSIASSTQKIIKI